VLRYEDGAEVLRAYGARHGALPAPRTLRQRLHRRRRARAGAAHLGVGTYIIATEPWAARARALLPSNAAIADINWILDYFRRSADHRLLFGGRVSYSAVQPPQLAEGMRRRMVRVFPSLARRQRYSTPGAGISTSP
jgi:hypothetical protein